MNKQQYDKYIASSLENYIINRKYDEDYRLGQAFYNTLELLFPEIATEIVGTMSDCFYDDSRIGSLIGNLIMQIHD